MIKQFSRCIREYKRPTILTLLFIFFEAVIEALIPFITARLVNGIQAGYSLSFVVKTGLILTAMACVSLCFGGLAGYTSAKASAGFAKNVRHDLFSKVQTFSFENIDRFSVSSLVTRMTTDVTNVQMSYMMIIRTAVRAPLMMLFCIVMAYIMGGALATSFVVVVPLLGFGLWLIGRKAMPAFRRVFRKYDRLNESIEENVRAMRVVKGFSREDYEKKKFSTAAEDIRRDFTKAERIVALNSPLMQICLYFNLVFVLAVGSKLVIANGSVNVGEISAMLTYGFQILANLMMISMIYVILTISAESIQRIHEVLSETPTLSNPEKTVKNIKNGQIDFDHVTFDYGKMTEKHALSNIDLHIESGMTVGILGSTGSGKTSLVQLIARLYDVTEGSVKVGGIDVREYDLNTLRNGVAMVLQKNELFSGTIKENLLWGNENATDEDIKKACRIAKADEFISRFPDGYDTHIEQGGTNVSGGQKQRLCIARALLKQPKVLIMDDSTSAVDTKTDALIRKGMAEDVPETTKLIIAQRVTSVMEADLILVIDNGVIAQVGQHKDLIAVDGLYKNMYEQQTKAGEDDE